MGALDAFRGLLPCAESRKDEGTLLVVAAVFCASRVLALVAGVRFDAADLPSFWHFAPLHLLETRLAETVFYLHFQPPLFNLYLGCGVGIFGSWSTVAFGVSFFFLGLVTVLALFVFMRRVGVGRRSALALTLFFALSPGTLLFESYLFYELPVAALLVFGALSFHVAFERGSIRAWATFFSLVATLVLTRALFHPGVLALSALVPALAFARHRRALLVGFAAPALVVLAVCLKNWVVFDSFSTSSWFGMGLARMTLRNIDPGKKAAWVREGVVSPVAAIHPPSPLESYAAVTTLPEKTGIPVLDEPRKPGGDLNLHHLAYARISKTLLADDWVALRREPGVYVAAARAALTRFFRPVSTWHPVARNRRHIALFDRVYNTLLHFGERGGPMLVLFPGALVWGLVRARRRELASEQRAALGLMLGTMAYVLVTGTLFEPLENMRFRYAVEPYLWTLVGLFTSSFRGPSARVSH